MSVFFFIQTGTDGPREPWVVVDAGLQAQQAGWFRRYQGIYIVYIYTKMASFIGSSFCFLFMQMAVQEMSDN